MKVSLVSLGLVLALAACVAPPSEADGRRPSSESIEDVGESGGRAHVDLDVGPDEDLAVDGGGASTTNDGGGPGDGGDGGLPALQKETKFGREVVRYATVHKTGHDRVMYIDAAAVAALPATGTLPNDTSVFMVVGSTVFVRQIKGGVWLNAFGPASAQAPTPSTAGSCNGCHAGAAEQSTFTLPALRRLVTTHHPSEVDCPRTSNTPCALANYATLQ